MTNGMGGMNGVVALIAEGCTLTFAICSRGRIVAMFAKGQRGDGAGEVDTLMTRVVLMQVAITLGAENVSVRDAKHNGGSGGTSVAHSSYAHKTGHERTAFWIRDAGMS